jgi:hypothetical protein
VANAFEGSVNPSNIKPFSSKPVLMILTISNSSSTNRILYGVDFLFFVDVFIFIAIAVSSSAFKISYIIIYYHIQSIAGDINFFYN